jgi:hypothetical protein
MCRKPSTNPKGSEFLEIIKKKKGGYGIMVQIK